MYFKTSLGSWKEVRQHEMTVYDGKLYDIVEFIAIMTNLQFSSKSVWTDLFFLKSNEEILFTFLFLFSKLKDVEL